ncbi:MAG: hypothetical protein KDC44_18020, partial [Phaeodactylibacter sp.]|nr:hypothetical protein [Phaeodactylibacter sp.]
MRHLKILFPLFAGMLIVNFFACTAPVKLVETGNYDEAIDVAIKRLVGKKKKPEYVQSLEEAFSKAMYQDMRLIDNLKAENRGENWEQIYRIYDGIDARQQKIEPLLPLIDENGYEAQFKFIRVASLQQEAKEETADYYYQKGSLFMQDARKGDKLAARNAYSSFTSIDQYYGDYRDTRQLKEEAHNLGVTHILIKTSNASLASLPPSFERVLLDFSVSDLNTVWKQYHTTPQAGTPFDYTILVKLTEIGLGPEVTNQREYVDHKEIEEGFEYVLDENGNVMKDSLGNDIKIPKKVSIKATAFETFQQKVAGVSGRIEYIDNATNNMMRAENIAVDAVF